MMALTSRNVSFMKNKLHIAQEHIVWGTTTDANRPLRNATAWRNMSASNDRPSKRKEKGQKIGTWVEKKATCEATGSKG